MNPVKYHILYRGQSNHELSLVFFLSFIGLIYLHEQEAKPIDLK